MALALLLQPQVLDRLNALDAGQAFADDALALLQRLFAEPANLLTVAGAFEKGFRAAGERLLARLEPRLDPVMASVRELLAPLLGPVQNIAGKAGDAADGGSVIELLCELLETAANALAALDESQLRGLVRRVDTLLSQTLGLDQQGLHDELRQIYVVVREELLTQVPVLEAKQAAIALAAVNFLGRLEDEVFAQAATLDLQPDRLAQRLLAQIDASGFQTWRSKLLCIVETLRALLTGGAALFEQAKPSVFGPSSGGAAQVRAPLASDQYCWYASWLYRDERRTMLPEPSQSFWPSVGHLTLWGLTQVPGFPGDQVWLSKADQGQNAQLVLRRAFWADAVLHESATDFSWEQAPQFVTASGKETFTFGMFPAGFLERWTQVSAGVLELVKTGGHIAGAATGQGYVTNVPLALWNSVRAASTVFAQAPFPAFVNHRLGWNVGVQWLWSAIPNAASWFGYLEAPDESKKIDALDTLFATSPEPLKHDGSGLLCDLGEGLLAVFTLLNYQGPSAQGVVQGDDRRPLNRNSDGPIVSLMGDLAAFVVEATTPDDIAKQLEPKNGVFWLYCLLYVPAMSMAGALVGTLISWALARAVTPEQFWKNPLKQAGLGVAKYFFTHVAGPPE